MHRQDPSNLDDSAVVRRVRAGDVDAYEVLIARHERSVLRTVARGVPRDRAAEVAHEVFVAAYISLEHYKPTHSFERWLMRIALRTCADFWRAHYRERDRLEDHPESATIAAPAKGAPDDREWLAWALSRLSLEDRQTLELVHFEGLSTRECADVLGWSESKVKVRAHRARSQLREHLQRALPELRNES